MFERFSRSFGLLGGLTAVALGVTACGSDDAGAGQGTDQDVQSINVTTDGTVSGAAIHLGVDQGFFEDEGLELSLSSNGNPPSAAAALQSNSVHFSSVPLIPGLNAIGQGLDVYSIAAASGYPDGVDSDSEHATFGVYVQPDSDIERPADLEGKQVATNARQNIFEAYVIDEVGEDGGNPDSIEWTAIDFSSQVEALRQGRIDAATLAMPFTVSAEENGARMVWSPGVGFHQKGATSTWMVGPEVAEDQDLIERFQRAIQQSNEYANENREEAVAKAAEITEIDEDLITEAGRFNYFPPTYEEEDIQRVNEKLVDVGYLDSPADLEGRLIPQQP